MTAGLTLKLTQIRYRTASGSKAEGVERRNQEQSEGEELSSIRKRNNKRRALMVRVVEDNSPTVQFCDPLRN
jgi:hypothetical protein